MVKNSEKANGRDNREKACLRSENSVGTRPELRTDGAKIP